MRFSKRLTGATASLALAGFVFFLCMAFGQAGLACDQIPAGQTFRARLVQPISSYSSKKGDAIRAMLIESPECNQSPTFPNGTLIEGHVLNVRKIGLGLRHETAALEIEFDEMQPKGAPPIPMRARLVDVDNAREHVRNGIIHGIRSINSPQDHLSSRVGYLLTWHPDTILILPAYHAAFPVLPEPELYFPAGTDLLLKLATPLDVADLPNVASPDPSFPPTEHADIETMSRSFPTRTTTPKGREADVVNLAFAGTESQLASAFVAAGWKRGEKMSGRAVLQEIDAFMMERNNSNGPMSRQLLQGEPSDSTWEKGLDSLAKRDHLRIWSTSDTWKGAPIWLSASTRDVNATLSVKKIRFVHYIDPNIDDERERIVRDLVLAGCVDSVENVDRPEMPHTMVNGVGTQIRTDGAIAVVQLKDCGDPVFKSDPEAPELAARPPRFERYLRTQVLAGRDMWRENIFYDAFNVTRASVRAYRRKRASQETARRLAEPAPYRSALPTELDADTAAQSALPDISGLPRLNGVAQP